MVQTRSSLALLREFKEGKVWTNVRKDQSKACGGIFGLINAIYREGWGIASYKTGHIILQSYCLDYRTIYSSALLL